MSLDQVRKCDVFRTANGVETYRVQVTKVPPHDDAVEQVMLDKKVDWSPRGLRRGIKFIEKAMSRPGPGDNCDEPKTEQPADAGDHAQAPT